MAFNSNNLALWTHNLAQQSRNMAILIDLLALDPTFIVLDAGESSSFSQ